MAKKISLDNGYSFMTAEEAMTEIKERNLWEWLKFYMAKNIKLKIDSSFTPSTKEEYLKKYLELAKKDLVIYSRIRV